MVRRGRLSGKKEIDTGVRGILKKDGIGKHFKLDIRDDDFRFEINRDQVKKEAALDESSLYEPACLKREWMRTKRCATINYLPMPKERFVPSRP